MYKSYSKHCLLSGCQDVNLKLVISAFACTQGNQIPAVARVEKSPVETVAGLESVQSIPDSLVASQRVEQTRLTYTIVLARHLGYRKEKFYKQQPAAT